MIKTKTVPTQKKSTSEPAPKAVTILKRDFDAAIKLPYSAERCLLAQTALRLGLQSAYVISDASPRGQKLMHAFDAAYATRREFADWPALKRLRASLPIKLKLTSVH